MSFFVFKKLQKLASYVTLNSNNIRSWIMKSICVESNNYADILGKICEVLRNKKPLKQTWIVPNEIKSQVEWMILDGLQVAAALDIRVISLSELANDFFQVESMSRFERTLLMQKVLILHKAEFKLCSLTSFALAQIFLDAIDKFRTNGISLETLQKKVALLNGALKLKLHDICLAWKYYLELKGEYVDELDKLEKLAPLLKEQESNDCFIFFGWAQFNILEQKILAECIQKGNSIVGLCVPTEGQINADIYTQETKLAIRRLIDKKSLDVEWVCRECTLPDWGTHLLQNVMGSSPTMHNMQTDHIRLFSATNVNAELELVAQEIKKCIYNGARYRDCVVVCPSLSSYTAPIKKIFTAFKIPYSMRESISIDSVESIKFVLQALECVKNNFSKKDLLKFAFHPFSGFSKEERNSFDEIINYYSIANESFVEFQPLPDEELSSQFLGYREKFTPLLNLSKLVNANSKIADFVQGLKAFLDAFEYEKKSFGRGNSTIEELNWAGCNKLLRVIETLATNMGDVCVDLAQFILILRAGLGSLSNRNKQKIDEVLVESENIVERRKFVFIIGAIEGNIPVTQSDVSFLDDNDLVTLKTFDLDLAPSVKLENVRSREQALLTLSTALEKLTITYPLNAGQEKCEGAGVLDDLGKCFTLKGTPLVTMFWGAVSQDDIYFGGKAERYAYIWQNKDKMLEETIQSLANPAAQVDEVILSSAYNILCNSGYKDILGQILSREEADQYKLTSPENVFFYKDKVRVTQIEKFFECPYAHFVDFGLLPKEKRIGSPQAVDIGNIIHMVLERFGRLYMQNKITAENLEIEVSKIFDKVLNMSQFSHLLYNPSNANFFKVLKNEAIRACLAVDYQLVHGQYKLKFVEASFGSDGFAKIPQIVIDDKKPISVVGKIDRADMWGNRVRLIDYKTSKSSGKFSLANFYLGKKIQLFYYLSVLHDELGVQPGGAYYMPVHREYSPENGKSVSFKLDGVSLFTEANMLAQDDQVNFEHPSSDILKFEISVSAENKKNGCFKLNKRVGSGASENQFMALLDYAQDVLKGAVEDLWHGEIRPMPVSGACAFCKYRCLCKWGTSKLMHERESNFSVGMNDFFEEKTDEV